ncbi:MAG TPA: alpha/beta family hydrolase [Albitalea sp.]|nr:alpha/beta family hydrolase [Albitalea sp.]
MQSLAGDLAWSTEPRGLVVFAHGSGSSRLSPRNQFVAQVMHEQHLATLLFDLLTDAEAADRRNVFDIGLLSERVEEALDWVDSRPAWAGLPVGLFGASTGAAAALQAAASRPGRVASVVSRGGRPDLAGDYLARVEAPTLLIVGGLDDAVLALNRAALSQLRCNKRLEVVPGATHLFEEPGTLDAAAHLAAAWFSTHLAQRRAA